MKKIAVLGLGKVGFLAAHLLDDSGFSVTGVDVKEPRLPLPFPVRCLDLHEAGPLDDLDYKTMWYPGHMKLMNFFFHELLMRNRRQEAGEILVHAKPPVDEDVVYVHVAAEGTIEGTLKRKEFVRTYRPIEIAGRSWTAIAWTAARSVVAVMEMVRDGKLPSQGFLKQEDVPLEAFLATRTGSTYTTQTRL